ncbi:MAG: hypothetical protein JRC77_06345 [Deltaproteobacteria bacterium]|nr:hypothetical protein [Deltaproteobacteria bacterium]
MRFLVITKRIPGILKGATPDQAVAHFTNTQYYFDELKARGSLVDEGRLVSKHSRFQIFSVETKNILDTVLSDAPNHPYVTREVYEIGSVYETIDRLKERAAIASGHS